MSVRPVSYLFLVSFLIHKLIIDYVCLVSVSGENEFILVLCKGSAGLNLNIIITFVTGVVFLVLSFLINQFQVYNSV